jgi:hypothetical protein
VHFVLDQHSAPSGKLKRPKYIFDNIDSLVTWGLEYSDEESGQERRRRRTFQRRKPGIMATNQFATFVETYIIPTIRASRVIQSRVSTRARFPPISPDQTRLATLLPGKLKDPITFFVEVISVNRLKHYVYEAVSYAWDFSKPGDVNINMVSQHDNKDVWGRETQSLFIRPHAADALSHIRQEDIAVTVWIDALCIDLANEDEKLAQSQNYAPIFAHARRVDVWIGEDYKLGSVSFDWIKRLIDFREPKSLHLNVGSEKSWENFLSFMNLDIVRRKFG